MTGILNALIAGVSGAVKDTYFNLVSLLLPGNGTNGAQNNTFLDSGTANSGSGFTITRNGNTTQGTFSPFSQTGWGNYFNGSSNYRLTIPDSTDLDIAGDFCLEFWVYFLSQSASNQLICIGSENSAQNGFILYNPTSTPSEIALYTNGSTAITTSSAGVTTNRWHHIALVRSGTGAGNTVIYVDGVSRGSAQITTSFTGLAGNGLSIGQTYNVSYVGVLNAYLSNVRLVNGSPVYTGAFTPPTTPLTAITNTKLLTCQSNRFVDANTQVAAKTITVTGSPSVTPFSPFAPTQSYSAAAVGGSGYFDGTGDYLSSTGGAATAMGTGDFTWELFVYITAQAQYQDFIDTRGNVSAGSSDGFAFVLNTGTLTPIVYTTTTLLTSSVNVSLNAWNHVALTRSGTTLTIWVNGASGGSVTNSTNLTNQSFSIGGANTTGVFTNGYISNVRIVKGTAIYTGAFTPPSLQPLTNAGSTSAAAYPSTTNVNTSFASSATSLLLNFTNAGVVDATAKNVLETVGNAQISNGAAKFGTTSIYFDGASDYLLLPNSSLLAFGGGDFTCEFWMYHTASGGVYASIFGSNAASTATGWFAVRFEGAYGLLGFAANNASVLTASSTLSANTWHHVALVRSGSSTNNLKWYLNGTASGQTTYTTNIGSGSTSSYAVGADVSLSRWYGGYIQDLRITKGYARYVEGTGGNAGKMVFNGTNTLALPTAPFPVQ